MGTCRQICLNAVEVQPSDSLIILSKCSLTSIKCTQKEFMSTHDSFEESEECPQDRGHLSTANRLYRCGDYQGAINEFTLALQGVCKKQSAFSQLHARIARSYLLLSRYHLATQHCKVALDSSQEHGWKKDAALCSQLMADIKLEERECLLAVFYYEKAMQGFKQLGQEWKRIEMMYKIGLINMELHCHDKVLQMFEALSTLQIQGNLQCAQRLFNVHLCLARIYALRGQYEQAICSFARCLQACIKKNEQFREIVFQFQQMTIRMKEICSFQEFLRLHALISSTPPLHKYAQI